MVGNALSIVRFRQGGWERFIFEVCGAHDSVDEDWCLWDIKSGRLAKVTYIVGPLVTSNFKVRHFQRGVAPPSPETTVTICQLTQQNIPDDFFMRLLKARVVLLNPVADKTKLSWRRSLCHNQCCQMTFTWKEIFCLYWALYAFLILEWNKS